ncbi:NRDE family protein [Sporosarcina sp. E16_8]|uniref:NRDE family protein n=1 Tax=Sporosarcina sp. E16_8 TaxID=2789295 RepID=UPI001A930E32|nr:NRDE family protein [Sporosarcina sp. E16_8]MBO0589286.1 NRDE family protein [Sporosarcina sp. E16_8]
MCLINFHYDDHPTYKLIVAANRDEFYERPTASAEYWTDQPNILAGRDLVHMGTWFGVTKLGRFAAVTNYRNPREVSVDKKTRGDIVTDFLAGNVSPKVFLEKLKERKDDYAGFNILVGDVDSLFYFSNKQAEILEVSAGTHGLSNQLLNTAWPKVVQGRTKLRDYVMANAIIDTDVLFDIISDTEVVSDPLLPNTGVGLDLERQLSPLFIKMPTYGTRSSTALLVGHDQSITFVERTFINGEFADERKFFI